MLEKVSLKTIYIISLLLGIGLILFSCVDPVDIQTFLDDDNVQSIIENNQEKVIIDPATKLAYPYLEGGNKTITGLKDDKYYIIESAKEGGTEKLTDLLYVKSDGSGDVFLDDIGRVSGKTIKGLKNNYTYKIREAEIFTGTTVTVTNGTPASFTVTDGKIEITPSAPGDIILGGFGSKDGYEVMAVAVSPSSLSGSTDFTTSIDLDATTTSFKLEGAGKTVDYVFAKTNGLTIEDFVVLTVITKPLKEDEEITGGTIAGVTKPKNGATDETSITTPPNPRYATVFGGWDPPLSGGKFGSDIEYTATITLTADAGYTFGDLSATAFTVTGAKVGGTTTTYSVDKKTATVKATFDKTDCTIDDNVIKGITIPAYGISDASSITNNSQYIIEGTVSWDKPLPGGKFAASTVYTATFTLTAKQGYTFTGLLSPSFFSVDGAPGSTTVSYVVNNGGSSATVTVIFPATGAVPQGSLNVSIGFQAFSQQTSIKSENDKLNIAIGTLNGMDEVKLTLNIAGGLTVPVEWYCDGAKRTETEMELLLKNANTPTDLNSYLIVGKHIFTAFVTISGKVHSAEFELTVTE
jgi:hypothetical protein